MESTWLQLLFFACIGSVFSLAGGLYLLFGKRGVKKLQAFAVPFAAGALLAASFFDLLPEALETTEVRVVLTWTLVGFLVFFITERFLRWFHHHHAHEGNQDQANRSLIVIGDSLHNFIDGLAIGAAFLVDPLTGIIVTLAVAAHEIPQEIGDFGLLLSKGMSRSRIIMVNIFSALATVVGASLVFGLGNIFVVPTAVLLALTSGFFIYIAASDIVPTIHQKEGSGLANRQTLVLLFGVLLIACTTVWLHGFIEEATIHQESQKNHNQIRE
ncbi:MAG TPA: ZIP family metal transporter [Candidatus Saccharimonadales bacterium]|nr:ZIP family metal transporter [Candidatus Saccharimonadales bacterium]